MVRATPIRLEPSWLARLELEFDKDYMQRLRSFLAAEKALGKRIYPRGSDIFRALDLTPFHQVRVVILGQDPYHGAGQAHGLCFSVPEGVEAPPSLLNIFKEISREYPEEIRSFKHGNLTGWARQGVLLLNAVLTVEHGRAASHQRQGWEEFTDRIVAELNGQRQGLVFMLWGAHAQDKGRIIDRGRHQVLASPHPSPLSASRGFIGNDHFRRCNEYLVAHGGQPIDWFDH